MKKIKRVLSHGHRKSNDLTHGQGESTTTDPGQRAANTGTLSGEGSHLAGANHPTKQKGVASGSEGYHPIYDQFTGHDHTEPYGEPTKATKQPPHSIETTNLQQSPGNTTEGTSATAERTLETAGQTPASTEKPRRDGVGDGRFALAGAAGAAAASSAISPPEHKSERERENEHGHGGHAYTFTRDPYLADDKTSGPKFVEGPHARDTANRTDPHMHIPGEFPDPTPAEEPSEPQYGHAVAGAAPTSTEAQPRTSDQLREPTSEHHYGRDAALAGAGAASAGGLYVSQREDKKDTGPAPATIGPHESNTVHILDSRVRPDPQLQKHYRAGPTGEDPATRTVDPHESNIANIIDPKVQPEPEEMKGHTTTGPYQSGTLNRLDPKADSQARLEDENRYGRDAAIAGGVGATGLGTYVAGKHQKEPTDIGSDSVPGEASPYSSSKLDPRVNAKPTSGFEEQRFDPAARFGPGTYGSTGQYHGRDATLTGEAVGGAALAGHDTSKHHPGSPHSNISPSQQPSISQQTAQHQTTQPLSNIQKQTHYRPDHHSGRDTAIIGSTGAAGYGAYEAAKGYGDYRSTQPSAAMAEQRYDPTVPGAHDLNPSGQHHYGQDAAIAGGVGTASVGDDGVSKHDNEGIQQQPVSQASQQPTVTQDARDAPQQTRHHCGLDAAVAGSTGTAGVGAYAVSRHCKDDTQRATVTGDPQLPTATHQQPTATFQQPSTIQGPHDPNQPSQHHYSRDATIAGGVGAAGARAYTASQQRDESARQPPVSKENQQPTTGHRRYDSAQDPNNQQHHKRDAAVVGAAGVAGAGAGREYSKHEAEKAEKERLAQQKELERQQKAEQEEFEKKQNEQQKEFEKQQAKEKRHQNKLAAAEEKHHQKELEKEEKKRQKELEKEEKKHQKELEKEERKRHKPIAAEEGRRQKEQEKGQKEEEGKEKKHHLFGFLHKKDKHTDEKSDSEGERHSKEYAASGAGKSTPSSTLSPDTARHGPTSLAEDASTASIKSGVLGFPQGKSSEHAALDNRLTGRGLDSSQVQGSTGLPDRAGTG
ncbi:hypothetical protein K469DRAFT_133126 [Zopfia rhizophila CBS 207.26]|uniref:Uncharacterized protein n=1 Tax=Zopfia rhizophila CBS 207.26 TaxID=1314779 RepID=A0A6A6EUA8_9PEZI|nr:hypothetical protein K469DRAFT_133126 [Zopfia rhizophila CBS 207.26]